MVLAEDKQVRGQDPVEEDWDCSPEPPSIGVEGHSGRRNPIQRECTNEQRREEEEPTFRFHSLTSLSKSVCATQAEDVLP